MTDALVAHSSEIEQADFYKKRIYTLLYPFLRLLG